MKGIRLLAIACLSAAWGNAAEIPKGTRLLLRLENAISTRSAKDGDSIFLRTVSPISREGVVVVPSGSWMRGEVVRPKRSARVRGRAQLGIKLETLVLESGRVIRAAPSVFSVDSGGSGQAVVQPGIVEQGPDPSLPGQRSSRLGAGLFVAAGWAGAWIGGAAGNADLGAYIGLASGVGLGVASIVLRRGAEVELRPGMTLEVVFDDSVALD